MSVFRVYVEKKPAYAVEAQSVLSDIKTALRLDVTGVRILNRYDADRLPEEDFQAAVPTVFSEPAVDEVYNTLPVLQPKDRMFAVEYLPGQFDQRADSCEQCISLLTKKERCRVRNARIYIISGNISDAQFDAIKKYLINDVMDFSRGTDGDDRLGPPRACAQGWLTKRECWAGVAVALSVDIGNDRLGMAGDLDMNF